MSEPGPLAGADTVTGTDVAGTGAFRVFAARTVARFAPVRLKTAPLVLLDCDVRVLLESLVDVFVANLTSFRAYIGSRLIGRRLFRRQRVLPRRRASGKKQGHRDYQSSRTRVHDGQVR